MDLAPSPVWSSHSHLRRARSESHAERTVALARIWTAAGILLEMWLRTPAAVFPRGPALLYASGFALYSLAVWLLFRTHGAWLRWTPVWLHAGDMVWVAASPLVIRSPQVLLLAYLFVLTAAALRWRPRYLLETGGGVAFLVGVEMLIEYARAGAAHWDRFRSSTTPPISWVVLALFAAGLLWLYARREAALRGEVAARATQRAYSRVSAELHDGTLQSLYTIEYRLERLRFTTRHLSRAAIEDIKGMQTLVHEASENLRDIVHHDRPLNLGSKSFVEYVAALVVEFERDTGITVRFTCEDSNLSPPPAAAGELIRIIQEALLNVRKHSGARHVSIGCGVTRGCWRFWIDDDGHGFQFSGRRGMHELENSSQGPVVIRERVSALGGELAVESTPGRGSRLEIALPKDAFA